MAVDALLSLGSKKALSSPANVKEEPAGGRGALGCMGAPDDQNRHGDFSAINVDEWPELQDKQQQAEGAVLTVAPEAPAATGEDNIKKVFAHLDADGDGFIGVEDLQRVMVAVGTQLGDKELLRIVQEVDSDGDDQISFKEFDQMMKADYVRSSYGWLASDIRRRLPFYLDDWRSGVWSTKTFSAALFMFFTCFTDALALGESIRQSSRGLMSTNEYLMMNAFAGMLHAIFSTQPLVIITPTGPVTLLFGMLLDLSGRLGEPIWPFFAWTGLFVGLWTILASVFGLSRLISKVTVFTQDVFAFFIGTLYMNAGISYMRQLWSSGQGAQDGVLLTINMAVGFTALALCLSAIGSTHLLTARLRGLLADYALTLTLLASVGVASLLQHHGNRVPLIDGTKVGFAPTAARPWGADLTLVSPAGVGVAALASVPIFAFFFMDQNISSALAQRPEMGLRKGTYYHGSLACIAAFAVVGPMLGLPFVTGALPHSPQFVAALSTTAAGAAEVLPGREAAAVRVVETRLAPLLTYALLLLPLCVPSVLSVVPRASVSGTLMFIGINAMVSTRLCRRLVLMVTEHKRYKEEPKCLHQRPWRMHLFTVIQALCVGGCWAFNVLVGLAFPLFVVSLVPFRMFVLPRIFSKDDLAILDETTEASQGGADVAKREPRLRTLIRGPAFFH